MSANRPGAPVKVLVVEDSPVQRDLLVHILMSDQDMAVVATASDGEQAVEEARRHRPDVIAMDVHMPKMTGLDATRKIIETWPTPIVLVSGSSMRDEATATFRALEAGALALIQKPNGVGHPMHDQTARHLRETLKTMAEVKVVRRWPRRDRAPAPAQIPVRTKAITDVQLEADVVAIGASTGGTLALKSIFSGLPSNFVAPILVVQHIAVGFTAGFAEWLSQSSGVIVRVAKHGESLQPGHAYIAPDEHHMSVERGGRITLSQHAPENGHRPSVSCLFRSVAAVFGPKAIGVLLTGMGTDGAEELKLMKERGAATIAQDKESSVIHGMPGRAISLDAATYVLSPEEIAAALGALRKSAQ
jgi:two-component system, chemotaxis family, protein-glutamate methylesterase/glutaminase